ncbi:phosphate ABC transporter substrate-binding protein PstS [Clostridium lacusfryxellense]|uniref:phosphate ABC transporter substrate-binding protein PstS n=1 Tax=Clostridium lacusfryxellense TaxID=205328 RepID=UPI001C0DF415|nr:phosphate ABC transporter substrate-binding protein PstS [Clostridium lacusfryxellense]MBU3111637.1 phosphate ABC transporter substrate-binding protein PstS [Clostridium lacusfryxellense]
MIKNLKKFLVVATVLTTLTGALAGCAAKPAATKDETKTGTSTKKEYMINAGGSSFVNPLFSKMFSEYNKLNPEVKVNYQSIGSGAGIKQLTEATIDFAASDAFMKDEDEKAVKNGVIHIPITVGAVAVIYNVEGVDKGLKLTQETLTQIYLGNIKKWNDVKIKADNSGAKLPDLAITPVYRSDSSGTTSIFTDYLTTVSPEWKEKVGQGKAVKFPAGIGAKGNEGVAGQVKQTPGSIGYTELAYATVNKISYADLKNKDGKFVAPSLEAATLAAETAAVDMPKNTKVSIVEKSGEKAYGIVGFAWILANTTYADADKKKVIVDLIKWANTDGQNYSNDLFYGKLPESIIKLNEANIATIK